MKSVNCKTPSRFTSDFVGDSVINLKLTRLESGQTYCTLAALSFRQVVLEALWPCLTSSKPTSLNIRRVTEPIRSNSTSLFARDSESLQGNALLPYISCCSGRVVIAVQIPQFLCRYVSILEDVVDNDFGSLGLDGLQLLNEPLGQIGLLGSVLCISQPESSKQRELRTKRHVGFI